MWYGVIKLLGNLPIFRRPQRCGQGEGQLRRGLMQWRRPWRVFSFCHFEQRRTTPPMTRVFLAWPRNLFQRGRKHVTARVQGPHPAKAEVCPPVRGRPKSEHEGGKGGRDGQISGSGETNQRNAKQGQPNISASFKFPKSGDKENNDQDGRSKTPLPATAAEIKATPHVIDGRLGNRNGTARARRVLGMRALPLAADQAPLQWRQQHQTTSAVATVKGRSGFAAGRTDDAAAGPVISGAAAKGATMAVGSSAFAAWLSALGLRQPHLRPGSAIRAP